MTTARKSIKLIHEGKYAAEVVVEFHYSDESWSPTMSLDDKVRECDFPFD